MKRRSPESVRGGAGKLDSEVVSWLKQTCALEVKDGVLSAKDQKLLESGKLIIHLAENLLGCEHIEPDMDPVRQWKNILASLGDFSSISVVNREDAAEDLAHGRGTTLASLLTEMQQAHSLSKSNVDIISHPPSIAVSVEERDLEQIRRQERVSTLGMFVVDTLHQHLLPDVELEQIAALLAGPNAKYLCQLLTLGPNNDVKRVFAWAQELYLSRELLAELLLGAPSTDDVLGLLRLAAILLFTRDEILIVKTLSTILEVVRVVGRLDDARDGQTSRFRAEEYTAVLWMFLRSGWGLNAMLHAWSWCPGSRLLVCDILDTLGELESASNLSSLFRVDLHDCIPSAKGYMNFVNDLVRLADAVEHPLGKELSKRDLPKYFISFASRYADPRFSFSVRQASLSLLARVWSTFTKDVERDPSVPKSILVLLNKAFRETRCLPLQMFSLACSFELLESFAKQHKPFAPYLYKTIIFSLIEFHTHQVLRDFILDNLATCLRKMPFAPVGVLIAPLVKQITLHGFSNLDLAFLQTIAHHQRLEVRDSLKVMDLSSRIALNDPVFGRAAVELLCMLLKRFSLNPAVLDFIVKVFNHGATMLREERLDRLHKALIVDVLATILGLEIDNLNNQLMPILQNHPALEPIAEKIVQLQEREKHLQVQRSQMDKQKNFKPRIYTSQDMPIDESNELSARQDGQRNGDSLHDSEPHQQTENSRRRTKNTSYINGSLKVEEQGEGIRHFDDNEDYTVQGEGEEGQKEEFGNDENGGDDEVEEFKEDLDMYVNDRQQERGEVRNRSIRQSHPPNHQSSIAASPKTKRMMYHHPKPEPKPKYEGLQRAFAMLDPPDSGFVDKVKFLNVVNGNKLENPATQVLYTCPHSEILKERKLQEKIRRFQSDRTGQIGMQDILHVLSEHKRGKAAEKNKNKKGPAAKNLPPRGNLTAGYVSMPSGPVHDRVQQDLQRIYTLQQERAEKARLEREAERQKERKRRERVRKRFDQRIEKRRDTYMRGFTGSRVAEPLSPSSTVTQLHLETALESCREEQAILQNNFSSILEPVFRHAVEPGSNLNVNLGKSFDEFQLRNGLLSVQRWLRFLRAYRVVPHVVDQAEAKATFFRGKAGSSGTDVTYSEFLGALAYFSTTVPAFSFEPDPRGRVLALLSHLRSAALDGGATQLKDGTADPDQKKILLAWANLKGIPSYQHQPPSNVGHPEMDRLSEKQEAVSVVLGILDDILASTFNIHFLIPVRKDKAPEDEAKAKQVIRTIASEQKVWRRKPKTVPVDTKLYPEDKIKEETEDFRKNKKFQPHAVGFGSSFEVTPDTAIAQVHLQSAAGQSDKDKKPKYIKPVKPLTEKEKAFLARVDESVAKESHKHVEKLQTKKKKERQNKLIREQQRELERLKRQEELRQLHERQLAERKRQEQEKLEREMKEKEEELKRNAEREKAERARRERQKKRLEEHMKKKSEEQEQRRKQEEEEKMKVKEQHKQRLKKINQVIRKEEEEGLDEDAKQALLLQREKAALLAKRRHEFEQEKQRLELEQKEKRDAQRIRERQKKFEEKLRKRQEKRLERKAQVSSKLENEMKQLEEKRRQAEELSSKKFEEAQKQLQEQRQRDAEKRKAAELREKEILNAAKKFDKEAKKELKKLAVETPKSPKSPKSHKSPKSPKSPKQDVIKEVVEKETKTSEESPSAATPDVVEKPLKEKETLQVEPDQTAAEKPLNEEETLQVEPDQTEAVEPAKDSREDVANDTEAESDQKAEVKEAVPEEVQGDLPKDEQAK